MNYLFIVFAILLLFAALGTMWFIQRYRKEKRSLWLGISFLTALGTFLFLITFLLIQISDSKIVRAVLIVGGISIIFIVLLFPIVLIAAMIISGIQLIRKEGFSFSHILSLGFGIAYIFYLIIWPILNGVPKSGFFSFLYTYFSFCFFITLMIFVLYTVTNMLNLIKVPGKSYAYIIVLGSGLKNGNEVTPLLASRVRKGIEVYQQNKGSYLVLSGGQGADEEISESEAMKSYALQQGVPDTKIILEDKSVNTRENLLLSHQLIKNYEKEGKKNILVDTTRYHVLRALLLAKHLGIPCDGRGSATKLYFSINAFVREWIAYLVLWRKKYISVLATGFIAIALFYLMLAYFDLGTI